MDTATIEEGRTNGMSMEHPVSLPEGFHLDWKGAVNRARWLAQRDKWVGEKRFFDPEGIGVVRFNRADRRAMGIKKPRPVGAKRVAGAFRFVGINVRV